MKRRFAVPTAVIVAVVAIAMTTSVFALLRWRASRATTTLGFWFDNSSFELPAAVTAKLGGPLAREERERIKQFSRTEIEKAFAGLRVRVTENRDAFWRVTVVQSVARRGKFPPAGETLGLGPLGGTGAVDLDVVAFTALHYAPSGATRETIIEGIGRGVGRVAVHEFAHQILGAAPVHDSRDEYSYEYPSPERASQYYGDLHWTIAWPLLQQKIGR